MSFFSILETMEDEITRLQKELENLQQKLAMQAREIEGMKHRLEQVVGSDNLPQLPLKKSLPTTSFSLENFIGLRLIHFIGMIVLVIGLSIGVKYAIDRNLISEGMRIAFAYAAGIVLYLLSLRLKEKYNGFSAILFSGGMASIYFTTFGAHV